MMISFDRSHFIVTLVLVFAVKLAGAQTYTYDNQAQLIGAAITSPESTRLILVKALDFCSSIAPSVKPKSEMAFKKWIGRHTFYLKASAGYRAAAKQMAMDPSVPQQNRVMLKKLLEVDFPRLVASQTEAVIEPLRIAKENGGGQSLCQDYIAALDSGKFDLKDKDPQLAEFYDKNAPR
jgi:hypothetical protein